MGLGSPHLPLMEMGGRMGCKVLAPGRGKHRQGQGWRAKNEEDVAVPGEAASRSGTE